MMLKSLKLENFKSYRHAELEFDAGITAILGPNGAGKTTLLQAVGYALYKQGDLSTLVRAGAPYMRVTLEFMAGGRLYRVVREHRVSPGGQRRAGNSALYEITDSGEKKVRWREDDITEEVSRITALDPSVFQNAVYVAQGELDSLLEAQASERKRVISKLLGLEDAQRAWQNLGPILTHFEHQSAALEGDARRLPETRSRLQETRGRLDAAQREAEETAARRTEADAQSARSQQALDASEARRAQHQKHALHLAELEARQRTLEADTLRREQRLREIQALHREADGLAPRLARLPRLEAWLALQGQLRDLDARDAQARERLRQREERQARLAQLQPREEDHRQTAARLEELRREHLALAPRAARQEEHRRQRHDLEDRLRRAEADLQQRLQQAIQLLPQTPPEKLREARDAHLASLDQQIHQLDEAQREEARQHGTREAQARAAREAIAKLQEAQANCPLCQQDLHPDHRQRILREYQTHLQTAEAHEQRLREEVPRTETRRQELRRQRETLTRLNLDMLETTQHETQETRQRLDAIPPDEPGTAERLRQLEADTLGAQQHLQALEEPHQAHQAAQRYLQETPLDSIQMELQATREARARLQTQIAPLHQTLSPIPPDPEGELRQLRAIERKYHQLQGNLQEQPALEKQQQETTREQADIARQLRELQGHLSGLGFSEEAHRRLQTERDQAHARAGDLRVAEARLRETLSHLHGEAQRFQAEADALQARAEQRARLEKFLTLLRTFRAAYSPDGLQKEIRSRARPLIESQATEVFGGFELPFSSLKLTDDYEAILQTPEGERTTDQVSGGERIAAALALRAGIARALAGGRLELLMLDEPTVHLDQLRRRELVQIVRNLEAIPQILVVTHDPEFENAADLILRVKKEGGQSSVTREEGMGFVSMAQKMELTAPGPGGPPPP